MVSDESRTQPAAEVDDAAGARPRRRIRLLVTVAAVILAVDVVTKILAVRMLTPGQPVSIAGDTVTWTLVRNSGAAFSMATGYTWILTLIASTVVFGIIWMGRRLVSPWWAIGLGMILGGALGNLVDRFFRSPGPLQGHVVDFLSVGWWPVFNVADASVVGGAVLLVALSVFGYDFDTVGRRKSDDEFRKVGRRKSDDEFRKVGRRKSDDEFRKVGRRKSDDTSKSVGRRDDESADG